MDLSEKTAENAEFMINEIVKKLKMATIGAIHPAALNDEQFTDLKEIYDIVSKKEKFSINEMEAIVTEIGNLRRMS